MAYWASLESSAVKIAEAFQAMAEYRGLVRFDGKHVPGYWVLRWSAVDSAGFREPGHQARVLIRTESFDRYAAAVVQAIASRRPVTGRKAPAIAPRGAKPLRRATKS
jgi:hypothetical protein